MWMPLLSAIILISFVSHSQNFDSLNRKAVEDYINSLPKSCVDPISGASVKKKKINFKSGRRVMDQCSKVLTSPDWWNELKELKRIGLRQTDSNFFNGIFSYTLSLIENKHTGLRIHFRIFADKNNKIDSLEMSIGTSTGVFCSEENKIEISYFDVFFIKRLLPFIRLQLFLKPNYEAAYYYLKSPKVYNYDFINPDKL